jgi:phenylacetate-coenzyme A ligase PaaK-like adenylate-forming protein
LAAETNISLLSKKLFNVVTNEGFNALALEIFRYQGRHNPVYHDYLGHLGVSINQVKSPDEIPFLPIVLFKSKKVVSGGAEAKLVFTSSGTTGLERSRHYVHDPDLYQKSYRKCFKMFYGDPGRYVILGLLPSYHERQDSSLVFMVNGLMQANRNEPNGFFLNDLSALAEKLSALSASGEQTLLIGVSFALLDFAEKSDMALGGNITVMETGGMKGRREEITREQLHRILCKTFQKTSIHSEYGMTELLSQAYSSGRGCFHTPPWMRVFIRDMQDPFSQLSPGKTGAINVIDLANIHSCSFIETQDIGRMLPDGSFEVLGRMDNSEMRGCSLLL